MLHHVEGSKAVAAAIAACRPQVISAYPIAPQTPIVENEFAALSAAIRASAAGARAYMASASQGLLNMAQALHDAANLGLPIVMTLDNRPVGAPNNSGNDHSAAMAMRESGWIQLFAQTGQEAADLHILAFRLAEELAVPTMVCVDGFVSTPALERIAVPEQPQVDAYLPPFAAAPPSDRKDPISLGAMVGPDAFTEVRYLQYYKQQQALGLVERLSEEFEKRFGRASGGLLRTYHSADAELVVVAMGSICGAIKDVVDEMRADGVSIGLVALTTFRPFPAEALAAALEGARNVLVVDRALDVGVGGPLAFNAAATLREAPRPPVVLSAIAGLGGRPVPRASLHRLFRQAVAQPWRGAHFLDLNERVIAREIHRQGKARRAGPTAESILRQLEIERIAHMARSSH